MFEALVFLPTAPDSSLLYTASYQPGWVVVSVLLATLGAYAALAAASRATAAPDALTRAGWATVSSLAFGVGSWAMHFVGMLAVSLPCRVGYDLGLTLLSVLPAILGGFAVFGVVWRQDARHLPKLPGSVVLGAGIGTMHYAGMAAMQFDGWVRYDPYWFAISLGVAVVLSWFALKVRESAGTRAKACRRNTWCTALILGGAVSGMHYTAMAAAYFLSGDGSTLEPSLFTPNNLAFMVSVTSAFLALAAMGLAALSRANAATQKLSLSETKLQAIIDAEPECIKTVDAQGRLMHMNRAGLAMIEADSLEEVLGQPVINLIAPEYQTAFAQLHQQVLAGGTGQMAFEVQGLKGGRRWLETHAVPLQHQGQTVHLAVTRDINEQKHAEQELRIAATAFESQQGMLVTDAKRVILRVNQAFTHITGYSATEAVCQTPQILKSGRHDSAYYAAMAKSLESTGFWMGEIWNRRKNGEVYPQWLNISAVKNAAGLTTHFVGIFSDITDQVAARAQIDTLAFYDPLTQLPNRRLLLDRLDQALHASTRHTRKSALLYVDLDNFKTLNDTLGHHQGDLLLTQVAQRLKACVREGDTVARLGSDEFLVMLEGLDEETLEAANQSEAVGVKVLAALAQEYSLASSVHHSTTSIGITLFGGEQQESNEEPLKRAELAMFQAKAAGRNALRFFDAQMQAQVSAHAALEADLRLALPAHQLLLHYQSQVVGVNRAMARTTGVEALLRWQHPVRGMVSPGEFIPLAEDTGLILPIGQWVLETACAQLAAWASDPALSHLTMAVNVSARQFSQPDFVDRVLTTLARTSANPKMLKLELTESMLVNDVENIIAKMTALKAHGVAFSLDDFGTGYSSLAYLKRLPLNQLKIDQGFVRNIVTDPNDAAIAKMVVVLAESMGLSVIAEGVELQAQADLLSHLGCHAYQGYLFSRPLTLAALQSALRQAQA
jgi:diguanylate cyclase (GGDEF)-like protein/PAS domain S-box-containing protein